MGTTQCGVWQSLIDHTREAVASPRIRRLRGLLGTPNTRSQWLLLLGKDLCELGALDDILDVKTRCLGIGFAIDEEDVCRRLTHADVSPDLHVALNLISGSSGGLDVFPVEVCKQLVQVCPPRLLL